MPLNLLRAVLDDINKNIKYLEDCRKSILDKILAVRREEYEKSKNDNYVSASKFKRYHPFTCARQAREAGQPYPRTCLRCGLGPCVDLLKGKTGEV